MSKVSNLLGVKDDLLSSADKQLDKAMEKAERHIFKSLQDKLRQLSTDAGKFVSDQFIAGFTNDVIQAFQTSDLPESVGTWLQNFDEIEKLNLEITGTLEDVDLSRIDLSKEKLGIIQEVRDNLNVQGLRTNIAKPLNTILVRHVALGTSVKEAEEALRAWLVSNPDKQGRLSRYVRQVSMDALNQYDGAINQKLAQELDMDHFAYVGSLIKTSRNNCRKMLDPSGAFSDLMVPGQPGIFPMSAIPEIVRRAQGGNGWNEATTPDTFFIYRMGYNCRHMVQPLTLNETSLEALKGIKKKDKASVTRLKNEEAERARKKANALKVNRSKYKKARIEGKDPTPAQLNAYRLATAAQKKRIDDAIAKARGGGELSPAELRAKKDLEDMIAKDLKEDPGLRVKEGYEANLDYLVTELGQTISWKKKREMYMRQKEAQLLTRERLIDQYVEAQVFRQTSAVARGRGIGRQQKLAYDRLPKDRKIEVDKRISERVFKFQEDRTNQFIAILDSDRELGGPDRQLLATFPKSLQDRVKKADNDRLKRLGALDDNNQYEDFRAIDIDEEIPEFKKEMDEGVVIKEKLDKKSKELDDYQESVQKWMKENEPVRPKQSASFDEFDEYYKALARHQEKVAEKWKKQDKIWNEVTELRDQLKAKNEKLREILVKGRKEADIKIDLADRDLYESIGGSAQLKELQEVADHVEKSLSWYKKFVGPNVVDGMLVNIGKLPKRGREYFRGSGGAPAPNKPIGTVFVNTDTRPGVVIHELTHPIEYKNAGFMDKVLDFYERRTKGFKEEDLSVITKRKYGYSAMKGEKAIEDEFINPYMGKIYKQFGSRRGVRATEITTMGVQLMFEDPTKLYTEDRDYFNFIFSLFRQ